jgi:hypothetical protein
MWIKSDNGYRSEGAYCPNGFKVNYKQSQYVSQVSSVPFFYTEEPEMSRFLHSGHPKINIFIKVATVGLH